MSEGQQPDQLERADTAPSAATLAGLHQNWQESLQQRTGSNDHQSAEPLIDLAEPFSLTEVRLPLKTLSVRTAPRASTAHPLQQVNAETDDRGQDSSLGASPAFRGISPLASRDSYDSLAGKALAHSKGLTSKPRHETVSFAAIAKNPSLARLARAELDEHQHTTVSENIATKGPSGTSAFYAHDAEVERQWTALEAVNADTKEESTLNKELSALICARLEASRKSTERFLGVLQVCADKLRDFIVMLT